MAAGCERARGVGKPASRSRADRCAPKTRSMSRGPHVPSSPEHLSLLGQAARHAAKSVLHAERLQPGTKPDTAQPQHPSCNLAHASVQEPSAWKRGAQGVQVSARHSLGPGRLLLGTRGGRAVVAAATNHAASGQRGESRCKRAFGRSTEVTVHALLNALPATPAGTRVLSANSTVRAARAGAGGRARLAVEVGHRHGQSRNAVERGGRERTLLRGSGEKPRVHDEALWPNGRRRAAGQQQQQQRSPHGQQRRRRGPALLVQKGTALEGCLCCGVHQVRGVASQL